MKGAIIKCLGELVCEKFGTDKWEDILEQAGLERATTFGALYDIDDAIVLTIIESTCKVLDISPVQAAHAFGNFWVNNYAPENFQSHYQNAHSAKDFLLKMDYVHDIIRQHILGANPPRFEYEWKDDNTLIMKYRSERGLIEFFIGLISGVGTYYNENLIVTQLGNDEVKIVFS